MIHAWKTRGNDEIYKFWIKKPGNNAPPMISGSHRGQKNFREIKIWLGEK